jgi:hypothetical protein
MARPGSTTIWGRGNRSAAGLVEGVLDDRGQRVEIQLPIAGDVRDRMTATDIQFGEDDAVPGPDVGHRGDHPANRLAVQGGVADL